MKTKSAKRARSRRISLAGGEGTTQRPTGKDRRHTNQPEDARKPALEARCRVAGIPVSPDTLKAAVAPVFGDDVGLCIQAIAAPDEAARLWDAYCRLTAARRLWRMRHLGLTGDPQNSAIAMIPDRVESDPSLRVDLRTAEERDRAADRAEAYWRGQLDRIAIPQWRGALRSAADGFGGPWWRDGRPTQAGQWVVEALRVVCLSAAAPTA